MLARGFRRVKRVARKRPKSAADIGHSEVAQLVRETVAEMQVAGIAPTREEIRNVSLAAAVEEMKRPRPLSKRPEDYKRVWEIEKFHRYKVMDELEARYGYAIGKLWIDFAAYVMACPIKRNPPNWQHGRLVYALARHRLSKADTGSKMVFLDIGSAKGFSASCMARAVIDDNGDTLGGWDARGHIWSVDTIDPCSNEPRNSWRDGQVTSGIWGYCEEFIPKPLRPRVHFVQDNDTAHIGFLSRDDRIGFAFVDGDHSFEGVARDFAMIAKRQQSGDIILFDDVQLAPVAEAVDALVTSSRDGLNDYTVEIVNLTPSRSYAIAVRQ